MFIPYGIFFCIALLIVVKSITIGSDFNFSAWFKHGKKYTMWYFKRESWYQYLNHIEKINDKNL